MFTRVWHPMGIAVLSVGLASLSVQAQMVGPLANTTVGNARLIVPDGSSLRQSIGAGETRWFVFGAEPGKTYVVEAVDPDSDLVSNTIGALHVYAANGTTTPPAETNVDCTAGQRAPGLEVPVAVSGMRCVVRAFPPSPGNTQNKRGLYVAVGSVSGPSFDIRVRESTIYGRWTTNGYDFHVELENTTADAMCAEVIFLPNTGDSYAGTWSGGLTTLQLTIPPFGANKTVFANGTLVGPDNKGTLRIGACPSPTNFVPTALHVSTYAYNPVTDKFLYFFTNAANNGAASNSWSAASGAGTVTSIATGLGLTGGPITTSGTINLAATNLLPTVACAVNQVPKWNGSVWTCAADSNSGGTVTSVGTGAGLTGGPITGSGTINLAGTQLLPTVACATNQIPKWNGSAWACAPDNDINNAANDTRYFKQGGNAFGVPAIVGTTDAQSLAIAVNGTLALQIKPDATSPILIAGSNANTVTAGASGGAIGGGGAPGITVLGIICNLNCANRVTDAYGTIGGGAANWAGAFASVGGGMNNSATAPNSTIAGGMTNSATAPNSMVAGGTLNSADGTASFAAGTAAIAGKDGEFVWADSTQRYFNPSDDLENLNGLWWADGTNTFNVRAAGGVMFVTGVSVSGFPSTGITAGPGSGSWASHSDRNIKEHFADIDRQSILEKVARLPIQSWNYIAEGKNVRHLGPVAQDFRAAFGLGRNETTITTVDADGVALAAIQGLNQKLIESNLEKEAQINRLEQRVVDLTERVQKAETLAADVAALKDALTELQRTRVSVANK